MIKTNILLAFVGILISGGVGISVAATDNKSEVKFIVGAPLFFKANLNSSNFFEKKKKLYDGDDGVRRRKKRSTSFSSDEIQGILDRHNLLRGQVSPEASNMEFMIWDDDLATMAQDWSDECLWEHGNPDNISPFSSVGQNLWLGTGSEPDGVGSTQSWYNEDQYYDYDTQDCSNVCGHYTQVVWASTYAVGCGRTFCSSVSNGWSNAYIVTCNYGPAGNYAGADPYKSGSSCTQCDSGVGECFENKCRSCSDHAGECDCRAVCYNCGTINNDCTCTCQDGHYGSDCSTVCENTHAYCGANPGWPVSWCTEDRSYVLNNCPLMCGTCNEADPNYVCDPSATTTLQPSATTTADPSATVTTTSTITTTQTTPTTTVSTNNVDTTTAQSCDVTCQNGGTLQPSSCQCNCPSDYQGDECEEEKAQVRYGVIAGIYTSISRWPALEDILLRIIGRIVTSWCNVNFATCCPSLGTKTSSSSLSYVDESHVTVASGYPKEVTADYFRVMLLVTPPLTTELCSSGSEYVSGARRKRDSSDDMLLVHLTGNRRVKRNTDGFLGQDALYQAVSENVDQISDELNVTVGDVEKGEVEATPSSGGLAGWAIAIIVIVVLLVVVLVVLGVMYAFMKKSKSEKNGRISPEIPKSEDAETGAAARDSKNAVHGSNMNSKNDGGGKLHTSGDKSLPANGDNKNKKGGIRLEPIQNRSKIQPAGSSASKKQTGHNKKPSQKEKGNAKSDHHPGSKRIATRSGNSQKK